MMTKQDVRKRLKAIKERMCDKQTFMSLYGLDLWDKAIESAGLFRVWNDRRTIKSNVLIEDKIDRWAFELFLQQEHYLPLKNASIRFAMSEDDFKQVISAMCDKEISMIPSSLRDGIVPGLYPSSLLDDLHRKLPSMKKRLFNTETEFIACFHQAIAADLKLQVTTIYSEVSKLLNDKPHEAAREFDVITGEPLGNRHQIWLDFKKPLALRPEACSILTYTRYEDITENNQDRFYSRERI